MTRTAANPAPRLARAAAPVVEQLEGRRLLAVTVANVDGILTLTGDAANDAISINIAGPGSDLQVGVNDQPVQTFARNDVGRISIDAGGGDDSVEIAGDVDIRSTIVGGDGNDSLSGGRGSDFIFGGAGDDVILGNGGRDALFGEAGSDSVSGGSGPDIVSGGAGDDTVYGGAGDDRVFGDDVDVTENAATDGNDEVGGSDGRDTLYGGLGADNLSGGPGTQDLANYSSRTADLTIRMGPSGAGISGEEGEGDSLPTDTEKVNGGDGNDLIVGTGRFNSLWGGPGNDTLSGEGGNDFLIGFDGDDELNGGSGDDTMIGGLGADDFVGSDGIDTVDYTDKAEGVIIGLGNIADDGTYVTDADGVPDRENPLSERDNVRSSNEIIIGGTGDDTIDASGVAGITNFNVTLFGGPGDDQLLGSPNGNDSIVGGLGSDSMSGFGGSDVFDALDNEVDFIDGGDGDDSARVDAGDLDTVQNVEDILTGNETA